MIIVPNTTQFRELATNLKVFNLSRPRAMLYSNLRVRAAYEPFKKPVGTATGFSPHQNRLTDGSETINGYLKEPFKNR